MKKFLFQGGLLLAALSLPVLVNAETVLSEGTDYKVEVYGSLRMQAESVHPDNTQAFSSYEGIRDAYSRLGIKGEYRFNPDTALFSQVEVPFDTANFRFVDPYDQGGAGRDDGAHFRVAQIGLRSRYGTLIYGQQWMPYYNAISVAVDRFSSYYSGFATYTAFRMGNTISYYSPSLSGLTLAGSYTSSAGNQRSTSRLDARRVQATATYAFTPDTQVALGLDDRGNTGNGQDRVYGVSASHQSGPWYFAAKYEVFDSDNHTAGSFSKDGNQAFNGFVSYTWKDTTFKAMVAHLDNYGEWILHLGVDHQLTKNLKLFAEFYREQETASITPRRGGLADFDSAASGGKVFLVGARFDF
jgi:predicted porin